MEAAMIAQLTPTSRNKTLEARVYRKWVSKSITKKVDVEFCCILIDQQGDAIQAHMSLKDKDHFNQKLKLGHAYKFTHFNCQPANPWQQTININTSLRFGKIKTFDEIPATELRKFPEHYFRFVTYNQLESRVPEEDETSRIEYPILTDYIGCLRSVGELKSKGDPNKSVTVWRKVDIENLNGNVVEFTMWDQMARKFGEAKLETMQQPVLIAVSSCSVTKYRSDYQLAATPATYFYLNPNIPEVELSRTEYRSRYEMNPPLKILKTPFQDPAQEMTRNRFPLKTLLKQAADSYRGVRFTSDATRGWYYISCNECNWKVTQENNIYKCMDHGEQPKPCYRYNFKGLIADPSATAAVSFFTPAADDITGYTCEQLLEKQTPSNPNEFPAQILATVGQRHVLQFHFNTTSNKKDFILDAVYSNKKRGETAASPNKEAQGTPPPSPEEDQHKTDETNEKQQNKSEAVKRSLFPDPPDNIKKQKGTSTSSVDPTSTEAQTAPTTKASTPAEPNPDPIKKQPQQFQQQVPDQKD